MAKDHSNDRELIREQLYAIEAILDKIALEDPAEDVSVDFDKEVSNTGSAPAKKRGRPKGSKNRPLTQTESPDAAKEGQNQ